MNKINIYIRGIELDIRVIYDELSLLKKLKGLRTVKLEFHDNKLGK